MGKKKWIITTAVLAAVVLSIGSYVFLKKGSGEAMEAIEPFPIQVSELSGGVNGNGQLFAGVVEPKEKQKIMLEPERGKVDEVFVSEGDEVQSGAKLFSYNNQEGQMQVKEKAIDVEMSNITVNQKKEEISTYRKQLKNAAAEEKNELQQQLKQAEVDLKMANLEAQKVKMDYEELKKKINNHIVTAKVNGIIQKIDTEQQQTDQENGGANSSSFMEIVNTDAVYVKGTVNELVKDELQIGQAVRVVSRKNPEQQWSGKIAEIGKLPSEESDGESFMDYEDPSNPTASNYPFKVQLDNHDGLDFGYHVFIELAGEAAESQEIVLPTDMIMQDGKKASVWKVKDGALTKQEVELGAEMEDGMMIVVRKGLTLDDYVVFPDDSLKEGKKVTTDAATEEPL
ncbi:efflux RND transporter periplasmic adaptor subunit [Bacillus sp. B190/17]|uniref:Efflux RND transporter periplasmic adaptor subunit n=1 Tax=Bacillus lumedeiriae TaxID=3058829 RepID=A0ABW8I7T6_9BACI